MLGRENKKSKQNVKAREVYFFSMGWGGVGGLDLGNIMLEGEGTVNQNPAFCGGERETLMCVVKIEQLHSIYTPS